MATLRDLMQSIIGTGWNSDVPTSGVRPDYGLSTAHFRPMQKSQHEPTLAGGETRSRDDLRSMLANVIQAAGMAAVPGVGPRPVSQGSPARVRPTRTGPPHTEWARTGEGEPPVPPGKVRLYNGGGTRWFSGSRDVAEQFAHEAALSGKPGTIRHIDVDPVAAKGYFAASQRTGASIPAEDAMVLPKAHADQAQPLFSWTARDYK